MPRRMFHAVAALRAAVHDARAADDDVATRRYMLRPQVLRLLMFRYAAAAAMFASMIRRLRFARCFCRAAPPLYR